MGKGKGKGDEHACRVNYLFQAGQFMAKDNPQLSHYYGQVLTVITEKTAPKKDFTMKRSMCKRCKSVLVIGENATYRLRKNRHTKKGSPIIIIGCNLCGERKRIPTSKGYQLKAEREGQILNGNNENREKASTSATSVKPTILEPSKCESNPSASKNSINSQD